MTKLLLGLTTTPGSDWREKAREIDELGIEEISLFPTFIKIEERAILFNLLGKSRLKSIPHVHLRDDHTKAEINFLVERFDTRVFNMHPTAAGLGTLNLLKEMGLSGYMENLNEITEEAIQILDQSLGLCFDYSHYEEHWVMCHEEGYRIFPELLKKYKIGCGHISAIRQEKYQETNGEWHNSIHRFSNLSEFDYMKKYTEDVPELICIELENNFKEQLQVKSYVEEIIRKGQR